MTELPHTLPDVADTSSPLLALRPVGCREPVAAAAIAAPPLLLRPRRKGERAPAGRAVEIE